jgi:uncharacterized protein
LESRFDGFGLQRETAQKDPNVKYSGDERTASIERIHMTQFELVGLLKQHEGAIRSYGVAALFLYGSHARGEATDRSDADLFFDRVPGCKLGLFDLARLQRRLEGILHTDVDLGTRASLHPAL